VKKPLIARVIETLRFEVGIEKLYSSDSDFVLITLVLKSIRYCNKIKYLLDSNHSNFVESRIVKLLITVIIPICVKSLE